MSSDDDCDYMSEKFLAANAEFAPQRPGLIVDRKRKHSISKELKKARCDAIHRNIHSKCKQRENEEERRQEGLNTPLPITNKGYKMLSKMGYKDGQAIGRSGIGIIQPIAPVVTLGRAGVGRQAALAELESRKYQRHQKRLAALSMSNKDTPVSAEEFRKRMRDRSDSRQSEADLRKCQAACQRLDIEAGVFEPYKKNFWPAIEVNDKDDESEVDDEVEDKCDVNERLDDITTYLKMTYLYCQWCGIRYESSVDMETNCPGNTKDDH